MKWLLVAVLSVVGCGTKTYLPYVVKQYESGIETLNIYVANEFDLRGGYYESLEFYNFVSFKRLIEKRLEKSENFKVRIGQTEVKTGFVATLKNPYTVVPDSSDADVILRIGISEWDYKDKNHARVLIIRKELFGLLGLIGAGDQVVYFAGEC